MNNFTKHLSNFEFYENKKNVKNEIDDPEISSFPKNVREFFSEKERPPSNGFFNSK